jgi:hypothetical protein
MLVSDVVVLGIAHPARRYFLFFFFYALFWLLSSTKVVYVCRLVTGGSDVATINVSLHATGTAVTKDAYFRLPFAIV